LLNICWRLGDEQSLSVRELLLLSLNKRCLLAITYRLKSESDFSIILSLNICWRLGDEQLLSVRKRLFLSLNIDWRFGDLLSLKQKR
jgi:hypothetical protein